MGRLAERYVIRGPRPGAFNTQWLTLWREGVNLEITPDEMKLLGKTSLLVNNGTGYLATLSVYHEIHCLVRFTNALG